MVLPVSVIIPTRNEEEYLPRLLEAIKKQTVQPAEVIVADNHSTDRTEEIAKSYGCRVVEGAKHPGIGRNNGARVATQPNLIFFDADVMFENDFLEKNVTEFIDRKLGAASCYLYVESPSFLDKLSNTFNNLFFGSIQTTLAYGHGICIFATKKVHEKLGGFDERVVLAEDWDYTRRANKVSKFRFLKSRKVLLSFRRFQDEGRIKLFFKYVRVFFYATFVGKIKKYIVPYKFAQYTPHMHDGEINGKEKGPIKPLISVVIAAYNEEKIIKRCVDAISSQTMPREYYEILVVDNNSTDDTAEIARKAGARVITYKELQGASASKQYGSYHAAADIIAYTDADSVPGQDWLENLYTYMQHDHLMCVGGTILSLEKNPFTNFMFIFYDYFALLNQLFGISLIWGPNFAVRKEAFLGVKGFDLSLKTSDDWEFVMRIQKKYGIRSTKYTNAFSVKTSSRKQEKLSSLLPYIGIGIINYVSIFLLRKSVTFGTQTNIR